MLEKMIYKNRFIHHIVTVPIKLKDGSIGNVNRVVKTKIQRPSSFKNERLNVESFKAYKVRRKHVALYIKAMKDGVPFRKNKNTNPIVARTKPVFNVIKRIFNNYSRGR